MDLSTMRFLEPARTPTSEKAADSENLGWREVSKGLFSVLVGYVLGILNTAAGLVLLWLTTGGFKKPPHLVTGDDLTLLLIGGGVLFLLSIFCSYLILRGKWRCMMNAPERGSAKGLMFASMICIFSGPAMNFASNFGGAPAARSRSPKAEVPDTVGKIAVQYATKFREKDLASYMNLAG